MKKVEIIKDGVRYLQRFEANKNYIAQKRAIQSNPHDESEFTSVWSSDPKAFDLITAKGYLQTLCEEMRWGKFDEKKITLLFFEEGTRGSEWTRKDWPPYMDNPRKSSVNVCAGCVHEETNKGSFPCDECKRKLRGEHDMFVKKVEE